MCKRNQIETFAPVINPFCCHHLELTHWSCDMVKGNESDVTNIAFEILPRKSPNSIVLYCFES